MHAVQDEAETIHLYVVREHVKQPYTIGPLIGAVLCLLGAATLTLYSAQHPYYEQQRLTVPVQLLPLRTFTAQVPIIPTGVQTYPATYAHGVLTFTNGSIIGQSIPAGFMIDGVATDQAVFVPAGNADGFGKASVNAHAENPGKNGNVTALAVNAVIGSSLYIRNLSAFSGGRDSYSVKFATAQDKQVALAKARDVLTLMSTALHYPCSESISGAVRVSWRCQMLTYHIQAFYHVTGIRISGKNLIISVWYVPRPIYIWVK